MNVLLKLTWQKLVRHRLATYIVLADLHPAADYDS
jgi:hypothetical protein